MKLVPSRITILLLIITSTYFFYNISNRYEKYKYEKFIDLYFTSITGIKKVTLNPSKYIVVFCHFFFLGNVVFFTLLLINAALFLST